MNRLHITAIASAIALALGAGATAAEGMSKDEYKATQGRIGNRGQRDEIHSTAKL